MAAGKFHWYTTGVKYIAQQSLNLETGVIRGVLLTDGYSRSTASHSAFSDITANLASASNTIVPSLALADTRLTGSSHDTIKFDADDINGFSRSGETIASAKYLVLVEVSDSASCGNNDKLVGFVDLNTDSGDASVGESTQINITWPSGGIGKIRTNP